MLTVTQNLRLPTAASILALIANIERVGPNTPAATAFKITLARKGRNAVAAGSAQALDDLMREVALADTEKADARTAILRAAWAGLMDRPL